MNWNIAAIGHKVDVEKSTSLGGGGGKASFHSRRIPKECLKEGGSRLWFPGIASRTGCRWTRNSVRSHNPYTQLSKCPTGYRAGRRRTIHSRSSQRRFAVQPSRCLVSRQTGYTAPGCRFDRAPFLGSQMCWRG